MSSIHKSLNIQGIELMGFRLEHSEKRFACFVLKLNWEHMFGPDGSISLLKLVLKVISSGL